MDVYVVSRVNICQKQQYFFYIFPTYFLNFYKILLCTLTIKDRGILFVAMRKCSQPCSAPPFPKHFSPFKLSVPTGSLLPHIANPAPPFPNPVNFT